MLHDDVSRDDLTHRNDVCSMQRNYEYKQNNCVYTANVNERVCMLVNINAMHTIKFNNVAISIKNYTIRLPISGIRIVGSELSR